MESLHKLLSKLQDSKLSLKEILAHKSHFKMATQEEPKKMKEEEEKEMGRSS